MMALLSRFVMAAILLIGAIMPVKNMAAARKPAFRVLAIAENGGHHIQYSKAARIWLDKLASENNFTVDYIENTEKINEAFLSQYQLFIQLDFPPYAWTPAAGAAFEKYITEGKGGWIGFHHATLLGEFDGYPMWNWFSEFMGGIKYKDYIPTFVSAQVNVEQTDHPVMKGVVSPFLIENEEWYIYDKSPRPNVSVIARVDEKTYKPDSKIKMGDHPVIWSNPKIAAKNVYIFMGHSPELFKNKAYTTIFKNAIFWAVSK